jgi:hypothetical protein
VQRRGFLKPAVAFSSRDSSMVHASIGPEFPLLLCVFRMDIQLRTEPFSSRLEQDSYPQASGGRWRTGAEWAPGTGQELVSHRPI